MSDENGPRLKSSSLLTKLLYSACFTTGATLRSAVDNATELDAEFVRDIARTVNGHEFYGAIKNIHGEARLAVLSRFYELGHTELLSKLCRKCVLGFGDTRTMILRHLLEIGLDWSPEPDDMEDSFVVCSARTYAVLAEFGHGTPSCLRYVMGMTFQSDCRVKDFIAILRLVGSPFEYPASAYTEHALPGESMFQFETRSKNVFVFMEATTEAFPFTWIPKWKRHRTAPRNMRRHQRREFRNQFRLHERKIVFHLGIGLAALDLPVLVMTMIFDAVRKGQDSFQREIVIWEQFKTIKLAVE